MHIFALDMLKHNIVVLENDLVTVALATKVLKRKIKSMYGKKKSS